jgi:biotin carboxyl carrier protein
MPTYEVTVGERVVRVAVRSAEDGTYVRVDDAPEVKADLRAVHGALHVLTLADERVEVLAAGDGRGQVRMALRGLQFGVQVVDEAHARLASVVGSRTAGHAHVELKAPMPGLLVRVLCSVGDEVEQGQPLAVLQAMKMENELSLPRGGKVSKVNVKEGQTVEQGQILVVLE